MKNQVLVVDDLRAAADEYARLISVKTKLDAIATDDPREALDIVRNNPITVAVLDQRMPEKDGTQLFREMSRIDPLIKAIMLTGEAEAKEVGEALSIGYADYLHKSEVEDLPRRVLLQYARYQVDVAKRNVYREPLTLAKARKGVIFGTTVEVNLASIDLLDAEFVFPDSWTTIKQIKAGESLKEVDKLEITRRYIHETESEERLAGKLGVNLPTAVKFKAHLESHVTEKFKDHLYSEEKKSLEVVREYKLPAEPSNPKDLCIVSRHFQRAPVYRRFRCLLFRRCTCCGSTDPIPVLLHQLTSKIATRQRDYMSDRSVREVDTGTEVY
ncbi:MAG: response regulator [Candidatus Tectomicrobia bacterium]|nr:response regulator [Candidatus Tectomicrobia bacterium]